MKPLSTIETQSISGGLRISQFAPTERSRLHAEPSDASLPANAVAETVGIARTLTSGFGGFSTAIPIAGFVASTWMTGEPIRAFPVVEESPAIAAAPDDSVAASPADASGSPSNADSFGGGGDSRFRSDDLTDCAHEGLKRSRANDWAQK